MIHQRETVFIIFVLKQFLIRHALYDGSTVKYSFMTSEIAITKWWLFKVTHYGQHPKQF
jgi:hypothetical protein